MKKYKKKPRYGTAQEQARRKHNRGGHEANNWRHGSPSGPAETGPQVGAGRGEEWFKEWWKKDGT